MKTVLLVEDDELVTMLETKALEKYGYKIISVKNGESAIKIVSLKNEIDIILMDIYLGNGMDGIEAANIISDGCDIPILFVSNYTESDVIERTKTVRLSDFISKNIDIISLVNKIETLLINR